MESKQRHTSHVLDFSASGEFIISHEIIALEVSLKLIFSVVEGQLRLDGVVRNSTVGQGLGVEFVYPGE